jgi:nucleoside-diphosphate-sugar epimerase
MVGSVLALTGVAGYVGQRLLALLDADPAVERVVGIDVCDPHRRARKLEFHRVDILSADLVAHFAGVDTVVHLAAIPRPTLDEDLATRVNRDGTARVLAAAGDAGVRHVVRPSSAAVYGAWANNPVPLTEDAALRPNPGYLPAILDAECERLVAEWSRAVAGRTTARLRIAPIVGGAGGGVLTAATVGAQWFGVRGAAPPVQVVHLDDAAQALALAATQGLDGAFNVGADGWLDADAARAVTGARHRVTLPAPVVARALAAAWASGLGDLPPAALPYLEHPWVVANDRLRNAGWKPQHTNEEALLLGAPPPGGAPLPWVAPVAATVLGAAGATWWLRRRSRR